VAVGVVVDRVTWARACHVRALSRSSAAAHRLTHRAVKPFIFKAIRADSVLYLGGPIGRLC
jgi:hypothetical protein